MYNRILLLALVMVHVVIARAQSSAPIHWERTFGGANADFCTVAKPTSDNGYILGGYSYSDASATKSAAAFGSGDFWVVKVDSSGTRQWDRAFGGTNFDRITAMQVTADGGYILGGCSHSGPSGNKSSASFGATDYWLVKIDANGNKQWDKSYGGTNDDCLTVVQQTTDGGYIVGGFSSSGVSGNKSSPAYNTDSSDYWVLKLNVNGDKEWEKSYGGVDNEELQSVQQTADGGYIVGGTTFSGVSGNKTSANAGSGTSDYWVLKLDGSGNKQWEKAFGGDDSEVLFTARQTADGGYILGGHSYSATTGNKSAPGFGSFDYWLVKVDASGNKQWDRSYGGSESDEMNSLEATTDGGYILGGISVSGKSGNKAAASTNAMSGDFWMVKVDANGARQWDQVVPASCADELVRLQLTRDNAFILAGLPNAGTSGSLDFAITKVGQPLSFSAFAIVANRVTAQLPAVSGANYALEASTDLVSWSTVQTMTSSGSTVAFNYVNPAGFQKRFYRVRQM